MPNSILGVYHKTIYFCKLCFNFLFMSFVAVCMQCSVWLFLQFGNWDDQNKIELTNMFLHISYII